MNGENLNESWAEVCSLVKSYEGIDPSQFNAFFSRLQPQAMSVGFLMLTADNDFLKNWIERHYLDYIKRALEEIHQSPFTVVIEVDNTGSTQIQQNATQVTSEARTTESTGQPATIKQGPTAQGGRWKGSSKLSLRQSAYPYGKARCTVITKRKISPLR